MTEHVPTHRKEWIGPEIVDCWRCAPNGYIDGPAGIDACPLCAKEAEREFQCRTASL